MNESNRLAKECIVTALIELMKVTEYDRITITDITKKAGVSRMAYYRNYTSKDDILNKFIEEVGASIHSLVESHRPEEEIYDYCYLLFDQLGGVYRLTVESVPECRSARERGAFPAKLISGFAEQGSAIFLCSAEGGDSAPALLLVTASGMVKCSPFSDYEINRKKFESMLLRAGDTVVYAGLRLGDSPITLWLSDGKKRVRRDPVSLTGRRTYGVRAVKTDAGVFVERAMQGK